MYVQLTLQDCILYRRRCLLGDSCYVYVNCARLPVVRLSQTCKRTCRSSTRTTELIVFSCECNNAMLEFNILQSAVECWQLLSLQAVCEFRDICLSLLHHHSYQWCASCISRMVKCDTNYSNSWTTAVKTIVLVKLVLAHMLRTINSFPWQDFSWHFGAMLNFLKFLRFTGFPDNWSAWTLVRGSAWLLWIAEAMSMHDLQ